MKDLHLIPFRVDQYSLKFAVTSSVTIQNNQLLCFQWCLRDEENSILWPSDFLSTDVVQQKKDNLWEKTCFEAFWSLENSSEYCELNVDHSGNWNIYSFSDYRQKSVVPPTAQLVRFAAQKTLNGDFLISAEVRIEPIRPEKKLKVSLTAVLEQKHHGHSYWALAHKGSAPDFHLAESFVASVNPS